MICVCIYIYIYIYIRQGARKHGGKIKALLKRSFFLTKPLLLGIGASKVLPTVVHQGPVFHVRSLLQSCC